VEHVMARGLVHLRLVDLDDDVRAAGQVKAEVDRLRSDLGMLLLENLALALFEGQRGVVALRVDRHGGVEADGAKRQDDEQDDRPEPGFPFHVLFESLKKKPGRPATQAAKRKRCKGLGRLKSRVNIITAPKFAKN